MANVIKIKRKTTTGLPSLAQIEVGEGVLNEVDNTITYRKSNNSLLTFSQGGGGGSVSLVETEIDFGIQPLNNKSFTINASVAPTNKVLIFPSPNNATGQVGNDWEIDSATFTAKCGTGSFVLSVNTQFSISGKRKIYYQII